MALDLTKPNPTNVPAKPAQQKTGLAAVIRSKIANTLAGKKGEQFVTDVVTLVNNDPKLGKCDMSASKPSRVAQANDTIFESFSILCHFGSFAMWSAPTIHIMSFCGFSAARCFAVSIA